MPRASMINQAAQGALALRAIFTHVKANELPAEWKKRFRSDPARTFRVVVEEEGSGSFAQRREAFLRKAATKTGAGEDSEQWIREIKAARVDSKEREPLS